jgi:hypothetical protein
MAYRNISAERRSARRMSSTGYRLENQWTADRIAFMDSKEGL